MANKKKSPKVAPDRARARREFLALRPARNPSISWSEVEGKAILTIPRANGWKVKIINIFFPVPDDKKVVLDAIGSHVWTRCDGENTIETLSRELQGHYKLGAREAELSLQQFFKDLGRRGYIGFVTEKMPPSGAKSVS